MREEEGGEGRQQTVGAGLVKRPIQGSGAAYRITPSSKLWGDEGSVPGRVRGHEKIADHRAQHEER